MRRKRGCLKIRGGMFKLPLLGGVGNPQLGQALGLKRLIYWRPQYLHLASGLKGSAILAVPPQKLA